MRNVLTIWRKELASYFNSPLAYAVILIFLLITGIFFMIMTANFARSAAQSAQFAQMQGGALPKMDVNQWVVRPFFMNMSVIMLMFIPIVTMRLFAEERRQGTLELLFTSPVTEWHIVLGKYLAALTLFTVMILATVVDVSVLFFIGNPDRAPVVTAYIGILLMGAGLLAIGLLISSFTENQIVAAILTYGVLLTLWVMNWSHLFVGETVGGVLAYLSVTGHFENFAKGLLDSRDLIFYLTVPLTCLFLTVQSMLGVKWKG